MAQLPELAPGPAGARWFSEGVQPHERELRAYLRGRFPSLRDVDDLVQETYARLLRERQINDRAAPSRAYLFVVARNLAIDLIRRRKVLPAEYLDENTARSVVVDEPDAAEQLSTGQELDLLDAAMRSLPPRCREILLLRRIEGLTQREIAARLGIARGTVNAQIAIGLLRCREFLRAHGLNRREGRTRATTESHAG